MMYSASVPPLDESLAQQNMEGGVLHSEMMHRSYLLARGQQQQWCPMAFVPEEEEVS